MPSPVYDLVIIGGGINGAGIAADAAGRGFSVLLAEKDDLASGTSSASSKLIHGGLRYLEHYEFRLVREALQEREVLLAAAPHIIHPLRFVLPVTPGGRPMWMLRAGLFLYDHLAKRREIPGSGGVDLRRDPIRQALDPSLTKALSYWDCWVDDARLVVLNARAAADRGAEILTRTRVDRATASAAEGDGWDVTLTACDGTSRTVRARALVNAAGPWVGAVSSAIGGLSEPPPRPPRLVKGSHIVVPRIAGCDDALLLQHPDGRVVFILPFTDALTLIGTTDVAVSSPDIRDITADESAYLLALANRFLRRPLTPADIRFSFAGIRPLYDDSANDPSSVTRDYRLELGQGNNGAPLLTVLGGKITTYRRLAEAAVDKLAARLGRDAPRWTASVPLPGAAFPRPGPAGFSAWTDDLVRRRAGLPEALLRRLAARHGTATDTLLGDARAIADLGSHLCGDLYQREVGYLRHREWARTPEDVLWRRTKAGYAVATGDLERVSKDIAASL